MSINVDIDSNVQSHKMCKNAMLTKERHHLHLKNKSFMTVVRDIGSAPRFLEVVAANYALIVETVYRVFIWLCTFYFFEPKLCLRLFTFFLPLYQLHEEICREMQDRCDSISGIQTRANTSRKVVELMTSTYIAYTFLFIHLLLFTYVQFIVKNPFLKLLLFRIVHWWELFHPKWVNNLTKFSQEKTGVVLAKHFPPESRKMSLQKNVCTQKRAFLFAKVYLLGKRIFFVNTIPAEWVI